MAADPDALSSLIEAVADGTPLARDIDEQRLSVEERRLLGHLRLVSAVAQVHRSLPAEPSEPLTTPRTTAERWGNVELIELVGEGAFGKVWRARDVHLDADVALKIFAEPASGQRSVHDRVLHEGRALARLRHPNVVSVHGVETHGDAVALRMELIRGLTLEQCLKAQGPYSAAEAAMIGIDLCRALAAVHQAGLIHRDVKAQNVMREDGGRIVLMDLGSGRLQSDLTAPTLAGTPLCLAPEVLDGAEPTERSDLYSVGVLLYHLVTNDYPLRAESIGDLRAKHGQQASRPLHDVRPDLPDGFVRIVERALNHDPESRFASAGEMSTALAEVTQQTRSSSPAMSRTEAEQPSRRLAWIAVPAVLCVALVALLIGPIRRTMQPAPAPVTTINRIAVLPFDSAGTDEQLAPLAQGIAMELTTSLGQIGALKVVPWSFMKRHAAPVSLEEIGKLTSADALVAGTLRSAVAGGNSIALEVRVHHAGTGDILWSQTFQSRVGGLLQLQADVARQIAGRFQVMLARREQLLLSRYQNVPPEAVELFLKGRLALETYSNNFEPAINYFQQAIAINPSFAAAFSALGDCYILQSGFFGTTTAVDAYARALQATNQAIALDPESGEAYAIRAYAKALLGWDWAGADADYQRALELDPVSANVRTSYSNFLTMVGRHAEAVDHGKIAEDRAPLSSAISRRVAWALFMDRRYDEAIDQLKRVLSFEPDYVPARSLLARTYAMAGRTEDALREAKVEPGLEALTAQVYAAAGMRDRAIELAELAMKVKPGNPYQVAATFAMLGEREAGLQWIATAFEVHDPSLVNIAFDPRLDNLRSEPQFEQFVRRMQFTSVQ